MNDKLKLISITSFFFLPILLMAQMNSEKIGFPNRSKTLDPLVMFQKPPAGYGEVPFFWWQGDSLTREKLTWQLDELSQKSISSLQVNYSHTDDRKGLFWGSTLPSKPALFTKEWWSLFGWFMEEANKRGMTVSLSDYTLGVGQGFAIDEVRKEYPEIAGYKLGIEKIECKNGEIISKKFNHLPISVIAYPVDQSGKFKPGEPFDLLGKMKGTNLNWKNPGGNWLILSVYKERKPDSYSPIHPLSGKEYVAHFFQPFEDHFPEQSKKGLNFFFSDELNFNIKGFLWSEHLQSEFIRRKGYDLAPLLAHLFENIGDITPKIRMDYNDVFVSLSEECFFEPVYNWHEERGLIYGCDHGGRGKTVDEFGDYFRTQRWNQAPGTDQPRLGKDIIKTKVASSIAHMYERPRAWLEGFYSSGWSTSSAEVADAVFANFMMGHTLLSLHGLYYSTPDSRWEWAPPCNHYRMPYWAEMETLLKCTERLSYLLSQGYHRADVAVLYPVEPVIAGYGNAAVKCAFDVAETLYSDGIDFDFMDYESLSRATLNSNKLCVSGEEFSILVIPSMKAIRHSSLLKALAFKKAGGIVIGLGDLPEATELEGKNSNQVKGIIKDLFDSSSVGEGVGKVMKNSEEVRSYIDEEFLRDFFMCDHSPSRQNPVYITHRKIGEKDYYAVYNADKDKECFFRAKGAVELWDPWSGETKPLSVSRIVPEGTYLYLPLAAKEVQILVFDRNKQAVIDEKKILSTTKVDIPLDQSDWNFEILPVLNNKFGDFHWPGTDTKIGAEVRYLMYHQSEERLAPKKMTLAQKWREEPYGYTSRFRLWQGLKTPLTESELFEKVDCSFSDDSLTYSLRYGVLNDPGHQGYHGLKMEMYDDFLRLGKLRYTGTGTVREAFPSGNHYYLSTYVYAPEEAIYKIEHGENLPSSFYLNRIKVEKGTVRIKLNKGANELILHYDKPGNSYLVFLNPAKEGLRVLETEAEKPLSMRWNGDLSMLHYDLSSKENQNGYYRFQSAPGLNEIIFWAYGDHVKVWAGNKPCKLTASDERVDGLRKFRAIIKSQDRHSLPVLIEIRGLKKGFSGGAAFPYPIEQRCSKGLFDLQDWAQCDGLRCYSGGAIYSKTVNLTEDQLSSTMFLNLGEVISTARVTINGQEVGVKVAYPYEFEIGKYLKPGKNEIRIIVYNTAGNHYITVPTPYLGKPKAGILGPVQLSKIEK